jgi:choline dehydrogenase-like flavoprotein
MRIDVEDPEHWPEFVLGGGHHMGTTRMADDPTRGVVDRNCRVHGLDNLYVIGGSVFPTGGAANPTLTIVALTLRLAEHLKSRGV